jgi:hypothetical protein
MLNLLPLKGLVLGLLEELRQNDVGKFVNVMDLERLRTKKGETIEILRKCLSIHVPIVPFRPIAMR